MPVPEAVLELPVPEEAEPPGAAIQERPIDPMKSLALQASEEAFQACRTSMRVACQAYRASLGDSRSRKEACRRRSSRRRNLLRKRFVKYPKRLRLAPWGTWQRR